MSPDARDFQTRALVQRCVLSNGAMSCPQTRHELPVQRRLAPVRALVGHDEVVDEDLGVAAFHGGDDGGQDLRVDAVGPVLDDGVQEVCSCGWGVSEELIVSAELGLPLMGCSVRKSCAIFTS